MKKSGIILVCKSVTFYAHLDEDAFFEWIKKIKCIDSFSGAGDELYLHVKNKRVSNACLNTLLALFYRYKIAMQQLAQFLNSRNKKWFYDNKKAYWHKKVFKDTATSK